MSAITDDHREWEVVRRYQRLLNDAQNHEFNVTLSYSMLGSILCWTMERIRTDEIEQSESDQRARNVFSSFRRQTLADLGINETASIGEVSVFRLLPNYNAISLDAAKFLFCLRNAFAHGDGRKIIPLVKGGNPAELIGFKIGLNGGSRAKPRWEGILSLYEREMRLIGNKVAEEFCRGLRSLHKHDSQFGEDARQSLVEQGGRRAA